MQFVVLLGRATALFYIPYEFWQFATLKVADPGQNVAGQLTAAVAQNHEYLAKAFRRSGVPVDIPGPYRRTALDEVCLGGNVEMARYLISQKAQHDFAPEGRKVAEFAAKMKPLVPEAEQQSGRPHIPGPTVEVTAPASPSGLPSHQVKTVRLFRLN
jgi:hypothetical protein